MESFFGKFNSHDIFTKYVQTTSVTEVEKYKYANKTYIRIKSQ